MSQKQDVEFRGVAFEHGRSHLIVPELNLDLAEALSDQLDVIADGTRGIKERQAAVMEVVLAAVRRNYPEMTMEDLRKFATKNTLNPLFRAATGIDQESPKVVEAPIRPLLVMPPVEAAAEESGAMSIGDTYAPAS